jgi:hypothetical protein
MTSEQDNKVRIANEPFENEAKFKYLKRKQELKIATMKKLVEHHIRNTLATIEFGVLCCFFRYRRNAKIILYKAAILLVFCMGMKLVFSH